MKDLPESVATEIRLRRYPYPYRAMLAICSDLDGTPDRHVYARIMRFLNTTDDTSMGPGVGLEVGNTIYFDMPAGQFAYWNTDDAGREMIRTLIRSGHIDALHSFGDLAVTRSHAVRALEELERHGCRLDVWIDHRVAPSNFGADIMCGHGDEPGHEAYHADLTIARGVRFVWRGRVTSVIGQDVQPSLGGLWTARHPVASTRTVAKEALKQLLARAGHRKYAIHAENRVLKRTRLRDGTPIFEFLRSNPHWAGVSAGDTGRQIGQVLTEPMLERLIRREGVCILYTHLGKECCGPSPFDAAGIAAFRRLAETCRAGKILVLTTRRVLRYLTMRDHVRWSAHLADKVLTINVRIDEADELVRSTLRAEDLAGLSFYVPRGLACKIAVDGRLLERVQSNPADHTGRPSVSIPLSRLSFPDVTED